MSRKTFWCIVVTAGGGAALMFAVKLAENFKNFEKFFFSKKFFFALKNTLKSSQHQKVEKNFFWVKSVFSFYSLTDQRFVLQI